MRTEKQISKALIKAIQKETFQKFGESSLSIGHIQYVVKLYWGCIKKESELLSRYTAVPLQFTDADCRWIANIAVAHFLEYWLENDSKARQTLYSFTKIPFLCMDEVNTDKFSRSDSDMIIQLGRARDKYLSLQRRRAEQIVDDEIYAPAVGGCGAKPKSWAAETYNFIELCLFNMWATDKQLSLLDFISFGLQPDRQYSDDWWSKQLGDAYQRYYANLTRINRLSFFSDTDIDPCFMQYIVRQYVTSCMVIRKIEQANRFSLIASISQNEKIAQDGFRKNSYYAAIFWGRYPASRSHVIRLREKGLNDKIIEDCALDVSNYEEAINCVFSESAIDKDLHVEKHRVLRAVLLDVIHLLYMLYPAQMLPHWRNKEFSEAAFFYRKQYPFIEEFLRCPLPNHNKEFNLNCKKQFQELARVENSQFSKLIYINAEEKLQSKDSGK